MKTIQTLAVLAAMSVGTTFAGFASAQGPDKSKAASVNAAKPATNARELTLGEIRRVDKGSNTLTIKHGDIKNIGMPGMTMVFQLKDPALLGQLKAGDPVRFWAELIGGRLVVTEIHVIGR